MKKNAYIAPSMYWVWVGMKTNVADSGDYDAYANAIGSSTTYHVRGERNVWEEEDPVMTTPTTFGTHKSIWDNKW